MLTNSIKQKRKDKVGKWSVPIPKVKPLSEDQMFKVVKSGAHAPAAPGGGVGAGSPQVALLMSFWWIPCRHFRRLRPVDDFRCFSPVSTQTFSRFRSVDPPTVTLLRVLPILPSLTSSSSCLTMFRRHWAPFNGGSKDELGELLLVTVTLAP